MFAPNEREKKINNNNNMNEKSQSADVCTCEVHGVAFQKRNKKN